MGGVKAAQKGNEMDEPLGNSEQLEREDKVTYKPKDKFSDYTDEDLLLELINRNVMFEAPKKTERFVRHYEVFVGIGDDNTASIILPQDSLFRLREIVYDEQSSNPFQLERENEVVFRENIWDTDEMKAEYDKSKPQMVALFDTSYGKPLNAIVVLADELTAFAQHWLDLQGYDVVKREPELLPCPVCGGKANLVHWDVEEYYIVCDVNDCPIRTLYYSTAHQAIKAWNVLPRKEKGVTQHEYDLRKGNPYDLNDVAKLTRKEK
jgi:hypothetical protein